MKNLEQKFKIFTEFKIQVTISLFIPEKQKTELKTMGLCTKATEASMRKLKKAKCETFFSEKKGNNESLTIDYSKIL